MGAATARGMENNPCLTLFKRNDKLGSSKGNMPDVKDEDVEYKARRIVVKLEGRRRRWRKTKNGRKKKVKEEDRERKEEGGEGTEEEK